MWPSKIDLTPPPPTPHTHHPLPSNIFTDRSKAVLLLWCLLCHCVYVLVICFYFAVLGKKLSFLAFCLQCFDCGAVALSASFFPFGVLDQKLLSNVSIPKHCHPFYLAIHANCCLKCCFLRKIRK